MEALHDLVRAGKVRYIGASSMWTWQFAQAQHAADLNGWTRFVSMQDQYNLLHARGGARDAPVLPRPGRRRAAVEPAGPRPADARLGRRDQTQRVRPLRLHPLPPVGGVRPADRRRRRPRSPPSAASPRAQVALAWLLHQPAVTAPIVGVTKPDHLTDAVAAVELQLSDDELTRLEEHYMPHAPEGFE